MTRAGRVVIVTGALIAAGIVFGALAGGLALTTAGILGGETVSISLEAFAIGAFFGAPLGAITAPLLAWLLLRRVPLGRMFLVCSAGTIVGGVIGWFAASATDIMLTPILGAFAGCLIAAWGLYRRVQRA